jgi:tRNA pseudouridine38-40 synthase
MTRLAAGVEYDGRRYSGWQRQDHAPSVQAEVERALSVIANAPVSTICAGRTDAGVHAAGQVVHFDAPVARAGTAWVLGPNSLLPPDISISWAKPVPDDFHARFSAHARRYRYVIHNHSSRTALYAGRACWVTRRLDESRMREAAVHLIGEHDFSAFRGADCQSVSPVRRVSEITVARTGDWVSFEVEANAFLHHMVRNIAGALIAVGEGRQSPDWALKVLQGRQRSLGGVTAGPEGLCLLLARYDARFGIPEPQSARFPFG